MAINSTTNRDFTRPALPQVADVVETTHMCFNFQLGKGYMRQVFKGNGTDYDVRFLEITGAKYAGVESAILSKVQKVSDDIELDSSKIDGVTITEIERDDYLDATR